MSLCRKCHDVIGDDDLKKQLNQYVDHIPVEFKTEQELYRHRLSMCEGCEALKNGMCGYCGCFVLVRAAKIHNKCPKPFEDQWNVSE